MMPALARSQARQKLIAEVSRIHQSSSYEASLPAFGLTAVGATKEQAISRLGTALSMLFDEANR